MGSAPTRPLATSASLRDQRDQLSGSNFEGIVPQTLNSSVRNACAHCPVKSASVTSPMLSSSNILINEKENTNILKCLLAANINITFQFQSNDSTFSPLFLACHYGLTDIVKSLINKQSLDINQSDIHGFTPLYIACYKGHLSLVQFLLTLPEIDVNNGGGGSRQHQQKGGSSTTVSYQYTPLYVAVKNGFLDIVSCLLQSPHINVYTVINEDNDHLLHEMTSITTEMKALLLEYYEKKSKYGLCAICWQEPVHSHYGFVPCGHVIVCRGCNEIMIQKNIRICPMCRSPIWCRISAKYV